MRRVAVGELDVRGELAQRLDQGERRLVEAERADTPSRARSGAIVCSTAPRTSPRASMIGTA